MNEGFEKNSGSTNNIIISLSSPCGILAFLEDSPYQSSLDYACIAFARNPFFPSHLAPSMTSQ